MNKEVTTEAWDFDIIFESEKIEQNPEYWLKQCSFIYNDIKKALPSGSIQPFCSESAKGEKAELITIFSTLVAKGITTKACQIIIDIIKIWLENKPKAKVTLRYRDGSTIELSGLSKSDAMELITIHQEKF